MKIASTTLKAFIPSTRAFFEADLFTITPGQPQNFLRWSQQFDKPSYFNSLVSVAPTTDVADPNGGSTAYKLTSTGGAGADGIAIDQQPGCPTSSPTSTIQVGQLLHGLTVTFSVWLRTLSGSTSALSLYLRQTDNVGTSNDAKQNLTITSTWQRFKVTKTLTAVLPFLEVFLRGDTPGTAPKTWDNSVPNIYAWGAQIEMRPNPGPYVSTVTPKWGSMGPLPDSLYLTSSDRDITWNGNLYTSAGPQSSRDRMRWATGLTVDTMKIMLDLQPTQTIGGVPILQLFKQGFFDGARFQLDRLYGSAFGSWVDSVTLFAGNIGPIESLGRTRCAFTVRSRLELLNNSLPRVLFQPSCRWALFDDGCQLVKPNFAVSLSVSAVTNSLLFTSGATQANGYFDLGTITFLTGANAGYSATVKQYLNSGGKFALHVPFPNAVAPGDTFLAFPGCDKTQATCASKFSNAINFGGQRFVPVPESAV